MAVNQETAEKIAGWYQSSGGAPASGQWWQGGAAASRPPTIGEAPTAPAAPAVPEPPAAPGMLVTSAPAAGPAPDVGNWYRTTLGRDAEQGGMEYWNSRLKTEAPNKVFAEFQDSARANGENVASVGMLDANKYTGPQSFNRSTPVDDWGRNVLGRELGADEITTWKNKMAVGGLSGEAGAKSVYDEFMSTYGNEVKRPMDWVSASRINDGVKNPVPSGPSYLDINSLDSRTVNADNETVRGQMESLLKADSPYMQQARYDAMRAAAERGMLNSTMAASGGEDAAIRSALNIATPDAATYGKAADYNVAMRNQARMYNADTANSFASNQQQFFNQKELAQMQNGQQLTMAQMQDATSRWQSQMQDTTSRYNTDNQYKNSADGNKKSLVNNVMMNMDLSPDRKAAMLEALGEGTSSKMINGVMQPGTGLAGAVYVMSEVGQELRGGEPMGWADVATDAAGAHAANAG